MGRGENGGASLPEKIGGFQRASIQETAGTGLHGNKSGGVRKIDRFFPRGGFCPLIFSKNHRVIMVLLVVACSMHGSHREAERGVLSHEPFG